MQRIFGRLHEKHIHYKDFQNPQVKQLWPYLWRLKSLNETGGDPVRAFAAENKSRREMGLPQHTDVSPTAMLNSGWGVVKRMGSAAGKRISATAQYVVDVDQDVGPTIVDVTRLLEGLIREFGDLDVAFPTLAKSPFFRLLLGAKPATATGQSRLCRTLTA